MHYKFLHIAAVRGLLIKGHPITLPLPQINGQITYTADWDAIPHALDMKSALGSQMLGAFAGRPMDDRAQTTRDAVHAIREHRSKGRDEMVVIVEADGEVPDFPIEHAREVPGCTLSLGRSPTKEIVESHAPVVMALMTALRTASPVEVQVERIAQDVIFSDAGGKPVYFFEITGHGTLYQQVAMTAEIASKVDALASHLSSSRAYEDVVRLLSSSLRMKSDPLHAFLAAWSALEVFVNKMFKTYEKRVFGGGTAVALPLHPSVLERVRAVMSDKFRLTDKFAVIADALDPQACDEDLGLFLSLKKIRDAVLHGKQFEPDRLPRQSAQALVSKYLRLHLLRSATADGGAPR